nr:MAK10-like protein [Tanacetum cinerariifolium]
MYRPQMSSPSYESQPFFSYNHFGFDEEFDLLSDYTLGGHGSGSSRWRLDVTASLETLEDSTKRRHQKSCDAGKDAPAFISIFPSRSSNWLERLPAGSISTWEDLTTRFLTQLFPPGRTVVSFVTETPKIPGTVRGPSLYDNESYNDPRDFAKTVKAISLPQDVPSTSDRRLIELENQVQRLMEAQLAPKQSVVNKFTSSYEICSGPHDTRCCMENPEQDFVDYASSRTDEVGDKQFTTSQGPRDFNEATNA